MKLKAPARRTGSRPLNLSVVLRHVVREKQLTRSELATRTGFTVGAVSRITRDLLDAGLLEEVGSFAEAGKVGPRFISLAPRPDGGYVIGVGIESSAQHVVMLDLSGRERARKRIQVPRLFDAPSTMRRLILEVRRMIDRTGVERPRIFGLGVSVIGVVDPYTGTVLHSGTTGWTDVAIAREMQAALKLPVVVDSWLNAINIAEHRTGLARGLQNVVLVHTTLGLGASLIVNDSVVRGEGMLAGQIAHVRVAGGNLQCACGEWGCLATLASGRAVLQAVKSRIPYESDGTESYNQQVVLLAEVIGRAQVESSDASAAIVSAGAALGRFLAGPLALINPDTIMLGGMIGEHPLYVKGVLEGMREFQPPRRSPSLSHTRMGGEVAGALLALEELVCSRPVDLKRLGL